MNLLLHSLFLLILSSSCVLSQTPSAIDVFGDIGSGVYGTNDVLYLSVTFDSTFTEPACQDMTLTINANQPNGSKASYISRETINSAAEDPLVGDDTLIFAYVVGSSDNVNTVDVGSTHISKALALNLSSCSSDVTSTDLTGLSVNTTVKIDTRPPSVLSITTRSPSGQYTIGKVIDIYVSFSKQVVVSGKKKGAQPTQLYLNSAAYANFNGFPFAPKDNSTIAFRYTVGLGEATTALDLVNGNSLLRRDFVIYDARSGALADLSTPFANMSGSLSKASRISVVRTGEKLPPINYYRDQLPPQVVVGDKVMVSVTVQVNAVESVNTKDQSVKMDFTTVQEWYDGRFSSALLNSVSTNETDILNKIWHPQLTFVNSMDKASPFDGKVFVFNDGRVQIWQRYISTFSVSMNVRTFPFDTQRFYIKIRSNSFKSSQLSFALIDPSTQEAVLRAIPDSSFKYSNYAQDVSPTVLGLTAGFDVLTVSFSAERMATFNSVNILFPLLLVNVVLCVSLFYKTDDSKRLKTPLSMFKATLVFSFVLQKYSPPVSYLTNLSTFIFFTYAMCVVVILYQYAVTAVSSVVAEFKKPTPKEKKGKKGDTDKKNAKGSGKDKDTSKSEDKYADPNAPKGEIYIPMNAVTGKKGKSAKNAIVPLPIIVNGTADAVMSPPELDGTSFEADGGQQQRASEQPKTGGEVTEPKEDNPTEDKAKGKGKPKSKGKKKKKPSVSVLFCFKITDENKLRWGHWLRQADDFARVVLTVLIAVGTGAIFSQR